MKITKKLILNISLIIWVIFSLGYMAYDIWSDFKTTQLSLFYQQGQADTINELIRRAQMCEVFPVFNGENQVNLINTDCLQSPETE